MQKTHHYKEKQIRASVVILFIFGFFIGVPLGNLLGSSLTPVWGHLTIAYGSEKATWMGAVQVEFTKWWQENYPDQPIKAEFHAYGSAQSMVGILNGEIKPVMWSPASSIWIPIFNTRWQDQANGQSIIENITKVIFSPVVIATWKNFNETYNIKGFNTLHTLIQNSPGTVKLGHTDPGLSNSGFMAVAMALAASLGKDTKDLTIEDLRNQAVQDWLREFESAAVQYGESTGYLGKMMVNSGPASINVAFLYENVVKDISTRYPDDQVIAIYPEEGILYSDHPFCVLNAPWVTQNDKEIAYKFINFIQRPEIVQLAMQNGFRPINSSLSLDPNIFNFEKYGISPNQTLTIREFQAPESGEVLARIPDVWSLTRSVH
ncbi:MAG: von Willebrand factor type A [Promethearchaeota archaeon CR_4]|nr:MAG: von Willebrand factor type A [Candidatus Lokiarchaeota archaeon CR_4]